MSEMGDATRAGYNRVAAEYARLYGDDLAHKPLERHMLAAFMADAPGRLCDLGCGPGQVAAYLHAQGRAVVGVDLADQMVEEARQLHPDIPFIQADMRQLPFGDATLAGIVAFYSLIHIPPAEISAVLREARRVLAPQGEILIGFHVGQEIRHFDAWLGETVDLDFHFFTVQAMTDWLAQADFAIVACTEREPYPAIEVQTQRAYIRARKTA
jgi:ubiquinone/menaquinone biosynthesis C-methylase UbiE